MTASVFCYSDPFGGDPFKGSDPFAADSFFAQSSKTAFSTEDPFSVSAGPFGPPAANSEPDLFASNVNEPAAPPATGPDPFAFKPANPTSTSKDPFMKAGNKMAESDPFGGQATTTGEGDPFRSHDGGTDPFSSSSSNSDLAVVSKRVELKTKVR